MDWEQKCIRMCAGVLLGAVLVRLGAMGVFAPVGQALSRPEVASFLVYLQTGRVVRLSRETPLPVVTVSTKQSSPVFFSAEDAEGVQMQYNCDYRPDLPGLLTQSLDWNLTGDGPSVLILHTHTTECYTKGSGDSFQESGDYRTLDEGYNMLCLGKLVAERLEQGGISVLHDTELHDYPSYNGSYNHAAASTQELLAQNPSIRLVIDLHRDAADTAYGQMVTECAIGGQTGAQLMFVVGTDEGPLEHPDWRENLSLALKLQVLLEREHPGICRKMNLTYNRYNQHLGDYALLVEIGAAGNTLEEAKLAAEELADAIIQLKDGYGN